jgi:F-type H+-transporting ATPase subunit b
MNVIPDPTLILLQAIPFGITLIALYFILFKPMLAYLDERADATIGARQKAKELEALAEEKALALQGELKKAQVEIGAIRTQSRNDALAEYNTIIEAARIEANQKIDAATAELAQETSSARQALRGAANDIASQIASQAIGRDLAAG